MQVLLTSGDSILTEDPSFLFSLPLFTTMNVRVLGIKQDEEGMRPKDLEQALKEQKNQICLFKSDIPKSHRSYHEPWPPQRNYRYLPEVSGTDHRR